MNFSFFNSSFDQDISLWDVSSVNGMSRTFDLSPFSQANYDLLLAPTAWPSLSLQTGVSAHFGTAKYGAGAPATGRATLVSASAPPAGFSWTIIDGGAA